MEEDIKIVEEIMEIYKSNFNKFSPFGEDAKRKYKALENLIKGYRELEEQIDKHVYFETTNPTEIEKNYIPKSKVKEKIEELEKYIYKGKNAPQDFLQYRIKAKIQVLQELMGNK